MPTRTAALSLALALVVGPAAAAGQAPCRASSAPVQLQMLLEKTVFSVDVLWLSVRVDGPTAGRLDELGSRERTDELEDTIARVAASARCVVAQLDFVRDVSLDRFLGGIRASSGAAARAELISEDTFRTIDENLGGWYAFLEGRGVEDGDRMTYRIRGDTLVIRYRTADGELLLDRTDVGEAEARSVMAGYFAPGSDFREGLMRSLFERATAADREDDRDRPAEGSGR